MERCPAPARAFLLLCACGAPAAAIGPDPIVEDERHRVSALMIQAHLEANDNSTVEGAKRAKEEDDIIPVVTGSQSLPELRKAEAALRKDIAAAEAEVPNIADGDRMPDAVRLNRRDTLERAAGGPRFDGEGALASLPADVPGPDEDDLFDDPPAAAAPRRPAGEIVADARGAVIPSPAADEDGVDDPFLLRRAGRAGQGSATERGSFELELGAREGSPFDP
jgi:hypothetical protein